MNEAPNPIREGILLLALAKTMATFPCCYGGSGNTPCTLNESEDEHELCLPHLADAILSGRQLTERERLRLLIGSKKYGPG